VKRLTSSALFLALALALTAPVVAHAGSNLTPQQKQAQKDFNKYNKQSMKAQKKQAKNEKKQMKQYKKQHQSTTTVT
jgi:septal ring factor EnvC (AmiA/AmiB activator)